jgi:drug/metabolite transporter (DMT)-like permease
MMRALPAPSLLAMTHPDRQTPWLSYGCLALSTSLIGSYVGLSKLMLVVFPIFLLAWLRFGMAALLMAPWVRRGADEARLDPRARRLLFLESFFGNFLFSICLLFGLQQSSVVVAGVILAGIPAAVALLSRVLMGERIAPRVMAGIALSVGGIAMVALSRHGGGETTLWGAALLLGAVFCEASYVVIGKQLTAHISPKRISALINLWGLALATPLGVWQALQYDFGRPETSHWALLLFYAAAASVVTVWLWMTGLKKVPAAQAGVFMVFLPVATALIGLIFLGEQISPVQLLAYGLALAGVLLATAPARERPALPLQS